MINPITSKGVYDISGNISGNVERAADSISETSQEKAFKEGWNKAIESAAMTAKQWGPPKWSWSESSLIYNDACDEISEAIKGLKR